MKILPPNSRQIGDQKVADDELIVVTTRHELATLAGVINEALETVEDWEFDTRLGVSPDQARALRDAINGVLRANIRPE